MLNKLEELKRYIEASKAIKLIDRLTIDNQELTIAAKDESIYDLLLTLKKTKKLEFQTLISICGVDYPARKKRFEVIYNLLSLTCNHRLRIKVTVDETNLIDSIVQIYPNACWYEREVWDMYGVIFKGNPDLRRILTDYGFEGHPLRKDFPLTGNLEVRYDLVKKEVVYEKVELTQEYRNFDFMSPWEGTQYVLPGDEKANK